MRISGADVTDFVGDSATKGGPLDVERRIVGRRRTGSRAVENARKQAYAADVAPLD